MPTIREVRKNKGLTQGELAGASGVSWATIKRIESGRPANRSTVNLLCRVLGIQVSDIEGITFAARSNKK